MSYDCTDFVSDVIAVLEADGYSFHEGDDNAPVGGVAGCAPDEEYWFCWAAPGMADAEVGETCDSANGAVLSALAHRLLNSSIPVHRVGAADTITVQTALVYPDALMHDLMTTAIESGAIGYWCEQARRQTRMQREDKDLTRGHLSVLDFEADIIDGPVQCDHPDIEAAEIGRFTMDAATMRQGIARLLAPDAEVAPSTRNAVLLMGADPEADQGDADTADAIVQFAVFGELVFG